MTLRDLLDRAAGGDPTRPYLLFRDEVVAIGEFVQRVDTLAGALYDLGVRRGHHVAVVLPNRPEFLYGWLALASLGAVLVPINPALTPRELRLILAHSDATGAIVDATTLDPVTEVRSGTSVGWVATADGAVSGVPSLREMLVSPVVRPRDGRLRDTAVAAVVYTSGTTGTPRGVLKSHRSYTRVAEEIKLWLLASPADRFFNCLPLFHTNAQIYAVLASLACGGSLVLADRFSASRFWDSVVATRATVFNYVGTMLTILTKTPATPAERQHRIRVAMGGGTPAEVERTFGERFGVRLVEGYGLTEASVVTIRPLGIEGSAGASGWPTAYCDVRIVNEEDRDCPPGSIGEIAVSHSDVLTSGYYKDPAATAAAFRNGWFFTGDLGWRDTDGELHFSARKKEIIRYRGENVSPAEVEAVLASHPGVTEVAVVGRPSEIGDEDICAVVVSVAGVLVSADELQAFCRARLAPFKVPTVVEFRQVLPKTSTHKIRREMLRHAEPNGADAPPSDGVSR